MTLSMASTKKGRLAKIEKILWGVVGALFKDMTIIRTLIIAAAYTRRNAKLLEEFSKLTWDPRTLKRGLPLDSNALFTEAAVYTHVITAAGTR